MNRILSNQDLAQVAPSIFATRPWEGMSERYAFIPTIDIVTKMRSEGFAPFQASQSKARIQGKAEFTKHMIRFRHADATPVAQSLGGLIPEIVLINSHDGASVFNIMAGCFRMVCSNGLIIGDTFGTVKVRHTGNPDSIIDASYSVVNEFPRVIEAAESFGQLRLSAPQQNAFAEAALTLKYEDNAPVVPAQILRAKRWEDRDPTLWNTMNVVQEHLIGGGDRGRNASMRRQTTRAVKGIGENARLNKALWSLTERMAELVKAS